MGDCPASHWTIRGRVPTSRKMGKPVRIRIWLAENPGLSHLLLGNVVLPTFAGVNSIVDRPRVPLLYQEEGRSPLHSTQRLSPSWVPEGARTLPHLASPDKGEEFNADTFQNMTSKLACTHGKPGSTGNVLPSLLSLTRNSGLMRCFRFVFDATPSWVVGIDS